MKTIKNILVIALVALAGFNTNAQEIQYFRQAGYDGLNVFETKKDNDVDFKKLQVKIGGDFAIQFQAVDHSNDANNLAPIGGNVNLPTANLNFDVQLADGVRMHLRTFLSSRHHNEAWVKGGYVQMDKLDFIKKDFLKNIMDVTTLRVGVDQLNYGDAHFRRSDNAMAIYNPFVGNYLMDAYTVEPFVEVVVQPKDYLFVLGISNGLLNPTVDQTITNRGTGAIIGEKDLKATFYGKVGIDRQVNEALRVRLTGSFINESGYNNGDHLYSGDRAGARYYNIFNANVGGTLVSSGDFSGRFTPRFRNNASYQINPFIQYKGLEFFGIYETSRGNTAEGNEKGSFTQIGTELLYRFGQQGQYYVAGRYNSVNGNADYAAGAAKPNDQEITRTNIGAGWFMTKNVLMKLEYVNQSYNSDATVWSNTLSGAGMNGVVLEAVISF